MSWSAEKLAPSYNRWPSGPRLTSRHTQRVTTEHPRVPTPMATYTLTVQTSTDDCTRLRQAGYRLFLAKQINGNYEVIWFGDPGLVNRFQWQSGLEVFESLTFEGGLQVDAKTTAQNIKFGEIATLGKWDHGRPATGASDQSEALSGNAVEKMLVWFDFKSHVGTVLANEIPYSVELEFTPSTPSQTVTYAVDPGKGSWAIDGQPVLDNACDIDTEIPSSKLQSVPFLS